MWPSWLPRVSPSLCRFWLSSLKSPFPRTASKCFLWESEVIRSCHSSPGAFCRRLGCAGLQGHRTKVENKAFPAAWEFLEGGLCLALSCHCPVPALPGAAVSPPQGCLACPSEPKHWSGASGISQVGQDPTHSLATAVYECMRCVYVCVCVSMCVIQRPSTLHVAHLLH